MRSRSRFWVHIAVLNVVGFCTSTLPLAAHAQDDSDRDNLFAMSLSEVLDVPITVASKGAKQSSREAPGSVTVLNANQIRQSGARDLWELLTLIPGMQITGDAYGTLGFGYRGLFHASRILVLIDGQTANEMAFDLAQLPNR